MSETRLSAADLRARLAGGKPQESAPAPALVPAAAPAPAGFRKGAQAAAEATPVPKSSGKRANSYGGKCVTCDGWVEAQAGYLAKNAEGKWAAEHITCPDPVAQAVQASEAPAGVTTIRATTGQTYSGILPGTYTLEKGDGDHRTFRVRVQGTEEDFAPGQTVLDHLTGPDNSPSSRDWSSFAFIGKTGRLSVWTKHRSNDALIADAQEFLADPEATLKARTCIRCNAELTVPESVRAGMGPTCRTKGW
jgi:hypothetical protein